MRHVLLFQIYSPLTSWGVISVGGVRNTQSHPTKSGVLGLVASALGYTRTMQDEINELQSKLSFGCRVYGMGSLLRDYHTTQVASGSKMDTSTRYNSFKTGKIKTVLSTREYIQDEYTVIALWSENLGLLSKIKQALSTPTFTPYLGRKSCPPAVPYHAQVIQSDNPLKTLVETIFPMEEEPHLINFRQYQKKQHLYWEADESFDGFDATSYHTSRDSVLDRSTWRFTNRKEAHRLISFKEST